LNLRLWTLGIEASTLGPIYTNIIRRQLSIVTNRDTTKICWNPFSEEGYGDELKNRQNPAERNESKKFEAKDSVLTEMLGQEGNAIYSLALLSSVLHVSTTAIYNHDTTGEWVPNLSENRDEIKTMP